MPAAAEQLRAGASASLSFSTGESPLMSACAIGNEELCNLLLQSGASNDCGALCVCAANGNVGVLGLLLKSGAFDLETINSAYKGEIPLHLACVHDHLSIAAMLLQHGANPCTASKAGGSASGNTALHVAAVRSTNSGCAMVALLLSHGADVNATSANGYTPLHAAALAGSVECCEMLLESGAVATALSSSGFAPCDVASSYAVKKCLSQFRLCKRTAENDEVPPLRCSLRNAEEKPPSPRESPLRLTVGEAMLSLKESSKGAPPQRVRIRRERSVSSPFALQPRK